MLYLLDANVVITAHTLYYPLDAVPEYWEWLEHQATRGAVRMPVETYEEVLDGSTDVERDQLYAWLHSEHIARSLVLRDEVDPTLVRRVVVDGYAADLTDNEVESLGRDPFLVAHALVDPADRCVVTTEVSRPGKRRHNRKIPDVCSTLGVRCISPFDLSRELRFATNWARQR